MLLFFLMEDILLKIYQWDKIQAKDDILKLYNRQGFAVINFVYFAVIKSFNLFSKEKRNKIEMNYQKAILEWDFLLPDGIALQVFYYLAAIFGKIKPEKKRLSNLNWTDFVDYFLTTIKNQYWSNKLQIALHWTKQEYIEKTKDIFVKHWYNVVYHQHGYEDLNWDKLEKSFEWKDDNIKLLLVARSTVDNPIQELRAKKNMHKIKQNELLVMNTGGFFDFIAWVQKRAPQWVRTIKLEWLYRLIKDPKRNFKKVWNSLYIIKYIFVYLLLKNK